MRAMIRKHDASFHKASKHMCKTPDLAVAGNDVSKN